MVTYLQAQPDGTYRAETRKVWCYVQWPEEQALTHELRAAQAHIYPPDC